MSSTEVARILAVATAVPSHVISQDKYPDFLFEATSSNSKLNIKEKFQRICDVSAIEKRHFHLTAEMLKENPEMASFMDVSLNQRQDLLVEHVPLLAKEAAEKAISDWGQPLTKITHLVFTSVGGVDCPGADYRLVTLLGLSLNVQRLMIYQQGCFAGATAMRIAKDLAENNKHARVLVVSSELSLSFFRAPSEEYADGLVGGAIFGDGAAAVIVGSDPIASAESPMYELHAATQTIVPHSRDLITGHLRECGIVYDLRKEVPALVSENVGLVVEELVKGVDVKRYNDLFWVVHPGGRKILDLMEEKLELTKGKLDACRSVLKEYGNMSSASVLFVVKEMWERSRKMNKETSGEGLEWGVMLAFGPGVTIEAMVLKSVKF